MSPSTNGHGHDSAADLLDVAPDAVPALRDAFTSALTEVDRQIELAQADLRITAWAADPVSRHATEGINALAVDAEGAAMGALLAFRTQLGVAVDNLGKITEQYRLLEDDNQATVTQKGNGVHG
ncbi:transcriptional regulator [Actinokineospora sp.]|uniref:transcriptional regulator n=1 Tax=Actinokineospora sp. TaxID=1872133 RepID=UPI004037B7DC